MTECPYCKNSWKPGRVKRYCPFCFKDLGIHGMLQALKFAYAHLESMENYSLVSGAREEMRLAIEMIETCGGLDA